MTFSSSVKFQFFNCIMLTEAENFKESAHASVPVGIFSERDPHKAVVTFGGEMRSNLDCIMSL
jgi:hypothetical protein